MLGHIHGLNDDEDVDGILVQLPVPPHISERRVCNLILPRKDVDGFNVVNVGKFCSDQKAMVPATPLGVVELLRRTGECDAAGCYTFETHWLVNFFVI